MATHVMQTYEECMDTFYEALFIVHDPELKSKLNEISEAEKKKEFLKKLEQLEKFIDFILDELTHFENACKKEESVRIQSCVVRDRPRKWKWFRAIRKVIRKAKVHPKQCENRA